MPQLAIDLGGTAVKLGVADRAGILVSEVMANGGAEKAGVKNGDVIVEFEGKPIESMEAFRMAIANMHQRQRTEDHERAEAGDGDGEEEQGEEQDHY